MEHSSDCTCMDCNDFYYCPDEGEENDMEEITALKSEIVRLREALETVKKKVDTPIPGAPAYLLNSIEFATTHTLNASPEAIKLYHAYVQAAVALADLAVIYPIYDRRGCELICRYQKAKKAWEEAQ